MNTSMSTDKITEDIFNKITEYKNFVAKAEAEERQAKANRIAELERQILDRGGAIELEKQTLDRGEAIKRIIDVANHLISSGFYSPDEVDPKEIKLCIKDKFLLPREFGVYLLSRNAKRVELFGTKSVQTDGNAVYYTSLHFNDEGAKINDLEFFIRHFDEAEQTFYERINSLTKID